MKDYSGKGSTYNLRKECFFGLIGMRLRSMVTEISGSMQSLVAKLYKPQT